MIARSSLVAALLSSSVLVVAASASAEGAAPAPVTDAAKADEGTLERAGDDDGPFAPKGKTGRLRKNEEAATPKSEGGEAPESHEKTPGQAGVDAVIGFGTAGSSSLTSYSFVLGGSYRVAKDWSLGLRFPVSMLKHADEETGKDRTDSAVGNLELSAAYEHRLSANTALPIELAFVAPTAGGDVFASAQDKASLRRYQVNEAAALSRAFADDALFAPHRFGVVPKIAIEYERGVLSVEGFEKVELRIRAGGKKPEDSGDANLRLLSQRALGVTSVTGGQAFVELVRERLDLGARAWVAFIAAEDVDYSGQPGFKEPSKAQLAFEPIVRLRASAFRGTLGWIAPLGGRLNDEQSKWSGLQVTAGGVF